MSAVAPPAAEEETMSFVDVLFISAATVVAGIAGEQWFSRQWPNVVRWWRDKRYQARRRAAWGTFEALKSIEERRHQEVELQ